MQSWLLHGQFGSCSLFFFLIAESLLLAPGYPVLRGTLFVVFLLEMLPRCLKAQTRCCLVEPLQPTEQEAAWWCCWLFWENDPETQDKYGYLCFSVTRQAEVSGLCQIVWGKRVLPREAAYLPPSWTLGLLAHQRALSGVGSTSQRQSSETEWVVVREKNTGIRVLCSSVAPGSLGSCGCSSVPISGAGCGGRCVPKPELSHAVNLPQR